MKKVTKKDFINMGIIIASFFIFVLIITHFRNYYGSTLDWYDQHVAFPEYFRDLFYKTKQIFPDFAFNIGSGQNIYNFSYYGLLSPYVLFSYLLPFVNMTTYMITITILSVIISGILIYIWLRKKNNSTIISLSCALILMFATSMSFHSHRHIMFMNYMPFLIIGLFGVDRKLDKNRSCTLAISTFLMIMTSYYYSIGGIVALIIYGIYKYLKKYQSITVKKFIVDGISFIAPIILGILLSAIITLPTFQVILSGRGETHNSISLKDILIPNIYLENFMYESYGIGLTAVIILAIISLFDKKKENIFLAIVLSLFIIFPIFNYILNATMYIDSKSLIPLLPICIIAICELFNKISKKEIKYKKIIIIFIITCLIGLIPCVRKPLLISDVIITVGSLLISKKYSKDNIFIITICIFSIGVGIVGSLTSDKYVKKKITQEEYKNTKEIIDYITSNDPEYYRINLDLGSTYNNRIFHNFKYYNTTVYSSIYNMNYNNFYHDVINNNFPHRNRVITSAATNIISNIFTSSKYFVSNKGELYGYDLVDKKNDLNIYKNENVLPIAYASSNLLNYEDFDKIGYPMQAEALLNNIIIDGKSNSNFISNIKKIKFNPENIKLSNIEIEEENGHYIIKSDGKGKMIYYLDEEYQNRIIFIRFKNNKSQSCKIGDTFITINGVKNKLTCAEWKYHNGNYDFDYVISNKNMKNLSLEFSNGLFDISNIELYTLDYAYIDNVKNNIDELNITKMIGNILEGSIEVKEKGYFTASIPFDKGFTAFIDGKKINIEKVNDAFIGFPIEKGTHNIKIIYKAPLKNVALLISLIGVLSLIVVFVLEMKRKI